ncbi:DUF3008 family protein [bacterium]|nr:DUF3008 family protein [bacterium]
MPAVSKAQQSLMGQAWALRTGQLKLKDIDPKYRKTIKEIADGEMTNKELEKFASTRSKKLPHYVKEEEVNEEEISEKGIPVSGATSPLIGSKKVPSFSPGIKPGGGIKPVIPYLNPEATKTKKTMSNLVDYRDYIKSKKKKK